MTVSFVSSHCCSGLLLCLFLAYWSSMGVNANLVPPTKRVTRKERLEMKRHEAERYAELRAQGQDEVGHTKEAAAMRKYQLRKKMRKGLLRKQEADLASVLFPGASPELYSPGEEVLMYTDLVNSKKTQVPFEFYDLPGCPMPKMTPNRKRRQRKNLGARLQGLELKPAPYIMKVSEDSTCRPLCQINIKPKKVRWIKKLIERQYRIHMTFDGLPVLMRSKELNYAVRGFPIGFKAPPSYTGRPNDEFYLYNHLRFTITYTEVPESEGVHIVGFDVHPVSINHEIQQAGLSPASEVSTCNAEGANPPVNDPNTYLALEADDSGNGLNVIYSYEVEWVGSDLPWSDRWDVYLIGSPDDDIHSFAIINSLMIVLFLTGAIATIMIRTLRKDIAGYNEMQTLEEAQEETGWKLVHGDVFRPPSTQPMLFSVVVGTGTQIGSSFLATMLCAMVGLINPMKKGQTLTAIILLYVLSGCVSGYVSARIFKFCDAKAWKQNTFFTAAALPGVLISIFTVLNVFLHIAGAATAVHFLTLLAIFGLWIAISTPMVFVGSFFGFRAEKFSVPVKTNQIARYIPELPWYATPPISFLLGGVLPFGSVCIELFFIMSALWLHQIYYMMGFLLAVLLILAATCAEVSVVMTYLQLCAEDHRWWWKSFFNCASGGFYLFLYSLWFLVSRLDLVGILPVVVYLTYMGIISLCFGLFCGSVGVLCSFWFIRSIYSALKVD
ncbi:endomembrane protein 70-domain containing protein [Nitzschia inconspicua]|uniref:Transmembrane 9 superfamily member n=1 Tax=Nitzschia inconspicua TaxID=303405 RepID=A0A9K3Q0T8_9STRA|nr:endomembrane protein 70-domain containing protein [Nitzschia inconspicua]